MGMPKLVIATCDITSEGWETHQRSILLTRGRFMRSEEGYYDRRRINKVERGFLFIGGGFFGLEEGFSCIGRGPYA